MNDFNQKIQINENTNKLYWNSVFTSWHDALAFDWLYGHGFPVDASKCTIWHEAGMFKVSTSHNSSLVDLNMQCSPFKKLKPTFEHFNWYSKFVVIVQMKHRITTAENDTICGKVWNLLKKKTTNKNKSIFGITSNGEQIVYLE